MATVTDNCTRILQRRRLLKVTRKAYEAWGKSAAYYNEVVTDLYPCEAIIEAAHRRSVHLHRRYNKFESLIADITGLTKESVFNQIAASWPICPALVTNL